MNFIAKAPDSSRCEASYSELALMAICAICITAAINKQLAAQASDSIAVVSLDRVDFRSNKGPQMPRRLREKAVNRPGHSFQADCVRCIDDAAVAAAGQLQGPLLAAENWACT